MNINRILSTRVDGFVRLCIWLSFMMMLLLGGSSHADNEKTLSHPTSETVEMDVLKTIPALAKADSVKYLGFTNKNTFLIVVNYSLIEGFGAFKWISPISGKLIRSVPTDHFNPETPILSPDGQTVFALDDSILLLARPNKKPVVNYIRILRSSDLHPIKSIDIGSSRSTLGISAVAENTNQLYVRAYSLVPYEGSFTSANPGLELWDWQQNRLIRRLSYRSASKINSVLLSQDAKKLCCTFIDEEQNLSGSLQVLNPLNGERLWWTRGDDQRPVSDPIFYLPDDRIVSKDTVYDSSSFIGKPLLQGHPTSHCVSGSLCRFGDVFFQAENGLELWDIRRQILLKRWPTLRHTVMVYVSPDYSKMAVLMSPKNQDRVPLPFITGMRIQFLGFDRSLLEKQLILRDHSKNVH